MLTNSKDFLVRFAMEELRQYLDKQERLNAGDPLYIAFSDINELSVAKSDIDAEIRELEYKIDYWISKSDDHRYVRYELADENRRLQVQNKELRELVEELREEVLDLKSEIEEANSYYID